VQLANAGSLISGKYDKHFKDAALFLPAGTDWRLLKAQCYQESRLNPTAVSPVGAYGLCQFMPNTAKEMKRKYPKLVNFWLPETSINAAARYMWQMNNFWSSPRPTVDRYMLAMASYNAGAGNIHSAQKACEMKSSYSDIIECLPVITGRHSVETITYVKNIYGKWYVYLLFD
tara:strand:+ start:5866 stop:6384 length:519 start_codon:yes stop_codon:yes gene_type:complete